ncbi:MAG: membrane dipeptidase [Deltaproteobacteria bacterium]|nr:membrane dipeptidase [bacterium]MCB9489670.1 membrane dipeptidase [Deltaproteobacteria bacterium]
MARILDLHVHPSLKMYYLPHLTHNFHSRTYSGAHWNPLSFRTRYRNLRDSPIKVMLCTHYIIEKGFVAEGFIPPVRGLFWGMAPWYYGKLRVADPWKAVNEMMDTLEKSVDETNRWTGEHGRHFRLVKSYDELVNDLHENEIGLVHSIEGAHCLGYGPEKGETKADYWARAEKRLEELAARGVCLITPCHFWDNMFLPQTDGTEIIPRKIDGKVIPTRDDMFFHMKRAEFSFDDPDKLAEPFVRKCLELGFVLCLSHMQEEARWRIYELCEEYERPVTLTHVGLKHFFDHEYNVSDDEIKKIHSLGGVVGLIFSRRWLTDPLKRYKDNGHGIQDLIDSMLYIRELTGDTKAIGIGTDFDGLTDPFKDCPTPRQMHRVVDEMKHHFTAEEEDEILFTNSLRLLEHGWGKRRRVHEDVFEFDAGHIGP